MTAAREARPDTAVPASGRETVVPAGGRETVVPTDGRARSETVVPADGEVRRTVAGAAATGAGPGPVAAGSAAVPAAAAGGGAGAGGRAVAARVAYRDLLIKLMIDDPRLYCLDSDTGLFTGADFGPAANRYLNLGIAEQNLLGTAAGLAAAGMIPFVTTMATFATTRALEALKVDIAYTGLPVRIVATHGGLSAGHLGPTHHSLEDLAIARTLPGLTVVTPADADAAEESVRQCVDLPGPVYLRLGRKATPRLDAGPVELGRVQRLREGSDLAVFACGPHPVLRAVEAADLLAARGVGVTVLNVHTLKPLDEEAIAAAAEGARAAITVEEHQRSGGLGGAVAETLAERAPTRLARIGMPDTFAQVVGDHEHLLRHYGITAERIAETALALLEGRKI